MKKMKKVLTIILDVIIIGIILVWAYMLYKDFNALPRDSESFRVTLFNIKILLFALFVIASVTIVFYLNLLSGRTGQGKEAGKDPGQQNLETYAAGNEWENLDVMSHLEVVRKLLTSNLSVIENIWQSYSCSGTASGDSSGEETLLKEISLQTELLKIENTQDLLYQLADSAARLTGSQRVSVFMYSPEKNKLALIKGIGFNDVKEQIEVDLEDSIAGFAFKNAKRIFVTNIENHPELARKNKPQYKTKSFIIFPIRAFSEENVIGVLNITEKEGEGGIYTLVDLEKMNLLMNSFRLKLENLILTGELAKKDKKEE